MANSHDVVSNPFTQSLIKTKASQLCRRSDFSRSDFDDLRQGMRLYLLQRSHLFDPERGSLEAFVTELLKYWVRMELRFRGREKRRGNFSAISLEGTEVTFDGDTDTLDALISETDLHRRTHGSSRSPIEQIDTAEAVHHAFNKLSPAEQALLLFAIEHGVAAAAREWSDRLYRSVPRRWVENSVKAMRQRFHDSGLGSG